MSQTVHNTPLMGFTAETTTTRKTDHTMTRDTMVVASNPEVVGYCDGRPSQRGGLTAAMDPVNSNCSTAAVALRCTIAVTVRPADDDDDE